ncbi:hypothetical protein [Noviherbaspirillum aridicola]|uniref:Transmembrane protein n=1 Tax=Noviherbaspirillum aridicola TaxID=2849687 RepID=A0ABQ4QBA1_9BURK|nr:hypothetical protein [Noviherbaspirillum aridicola]GIZ54095.1 hypothetical protein NCCP691_41090 [Noviherbaspirillum aridicola]
MPLDSAIFQRTDSGRQEIQNKTHGLTQSERLVLIMVDGVTPCKALRTRLPVLRQDRFDRALAKLEKDSLIAEVLLPLPDQQKEELDKSVIDRFLRQDPLDPLTVLAIDPDELDDDDWQMAPRVAVAPPPALDEAHIELAESVREEVQALQEVRMLKLEPIEVAAQRIFDQERAREAREKAGSWRRYLPYALLLTGLAFIAGFGFARLLA